MSRRMQFRSVLPLILLSLTATAQQRGANVTNSSRNAPAAVVADHTVVAAFDRIPAQYLEKARHLVLYYVGLSHGTQPLYGSLAFERVNPAYSLAAGKWSLPPAESRRALRVNYYVGGPADFWASPAGVEMTRKAARSGQYNHFMFSWCGELGGLSKQALQQYLDTLNNFENEFPGMRFIYMTRHAEFGVTESLALQNKAVRNYAIAHNKVLYDFWDIETHDPDGKFYPDESGACTWCASWCKKHAADCANLEAPASFEWTECAHSHPFNCKIKAKAFWWMMARLAGWDGVPDTAGSKTSTPAKP